MKKEGLVTLSQAAKMLGVGKTAAWKMVQSKKLKAQMLGNAGYVIAISDIEALMTIRAEIDKKKESNLPVGYVLNCTKHGLLQKKNTYTNPYYRCKYCALEYQKNKTG